MRVQEYGFDLLESMSIGIESAQFLLTYFDKETLGRSLERRKEENAKQKLRGFLNEVPAPALPHAQSPDAESQSISI